MKKIPRNVTNNDNSLNQGKRLLLKSRISAIQNFTFFFRFVNIGRIQLKGILP
jgi:hypothetical protein